MCMTEGIPVTIGSQSQPISPLMPQSYTQLESRCLGVSLTVSENQRACFKKLQDSLGLELNLRFLHLISSQLPGIDVTVIVFPAIHFLFLLE